MQIHSIMKLIIISICISVIGMIVVMLLNNDNYSKDSSHFSYAPSKTNEISLSIIIIMPIILFIVTLFFLLKKRYTYMLNYVSTIGSAGIALLVALFIVNYQHKLNEKTMDFIYNKQLINDTFFTFYKSIKLLGVINEAIKEITLLRNQLIRYDNLTKSILLNKKQSNKYIHYINNKNIWEEITIFNSKANVSLVNLCYKKNENSILSLVSRYANDTSKYIDQFANIFNKYNKQEFIINKHKINNKSKQENFKNMELSVNEQFKLLFKLKWQLIIYQKIYRYLFNPNIKNNKDLIREINSIKKLEI